MPFEYKRKAKHIPPPKKVVIEPHKEVVDSKKAPAANVQHPPQVPQKVQDNKY